MSLLHFVEGMLMWLFCGASRGKPAPKRSTSPGEFVLGERSEATQELGSLVTITEAERERHVYIIGSTGTGKTTLLVRLFEAEVTKCR